MTNLELLPPLDQQKPPDHVEDDDAMDSKEAWDLENALLLNPMVGPFIRPTVAAPENTDASEIDGSPHDPALEQAIQAEVLALQARAPASVKRTKRQGNRRVGPLRVSKNGTQAPAHEDPIIMHRRSLAMPYWTEGLPLSEVRERVNKKLVKLGLPPVSMQTVRNDRDAIVEEWRESYDRDSGLRRRQHIAALNHIKAEAMERYRHFCSNPIGGAGAAAQFLKIAHQCEVDLADIDGSRKEAHLTAEQVALDAASTRLTRHYTGVDIEHFSRGADDHDHAKDPKRLPGN